MSVVTGGSKCNLITGYDQGEDNQVGYGKHRWLAQTFTLDDLYVVWRCRFKSWTRIGGEAYHYAIRDTDAQGKPTGADIAHTTLSPTGESFYSPGKWRRFDFDTFPNLPAGTYALVVSVPDSPQTWGYQLRGDLTTSQYPLGKAWESNDSGSTWSEISSTDFIFEVWGWQPPPEANPEPVISNWAPLAIADTPIIGGVEIFITTDIPVHLFMRWTDKEPLKHPSSIYRRGILVPIGTRFCFVAWHENEQIEPGDTLTHTFIKKPWPVCETRWFYFIGTKQAEEQPSASPIFRFHRPLAAFLFENYIVPPLNASNVFGKYWSAQTFTPTIAHEITKVKLHLERYTGTPGIFIVSIKATDAGGHPTGADLAVGSIDGDSLIQFPDHEWYFIPFLTSYPLIAGTKYAIVFRAPEGSMPHDFVMVWHSTTAPVYYPGNVEASSDSGLTWTSFGEIDYLFEEWGYPMS